MSHYACKNFNDLSARYVYQNKDYGGQKDVNLKNGFFKLIEHLSSKLNTQKQVRLNEIVTNVDYSKADKFDNDGNDIGFIWVTTQNAKTKVITNYMCKQLVVSVSLNVLKNTHKPLFKPNLPKSKIDSIQSLTQGVDNKLFFVFETEVFSLESGLTGLTFLWQKNLNFKLDADKECKLKVLKRTFTIYLI